MTGNPAADLAIAALCDLGCTRGTARGIVRDWPSLSTLATATSERLACHGVRPGTARRIVAAFRLVRLADQGVGARAGAATAREGYRPSLRQPSDVEQTARALWGDQPVEHFAAFYLDARQRVIEYRTIAIGSLAQVDVHPREIFAPAMEPPRAHSIILCHNHPSGDAAPSDADLQLTTRLVEAGRLVGVPVLDHLVITAGECSSLATLGLIANNGTSFQSRLAHANLEAPASRSKTSCA